MKNFDRSIEGTLRLYNQKGFHFKPQTHLALADVKVIISIPWRVYVEHDWIFPGMLLLSVSGIQVQLIESGVLINQIPEPQ